MGDRPDDFDEIVQHLDLDLSFPDEDAPSAGRPEHPSVRRAEPAEPAANEVEPEPFYRHVDPGPLRPRHAGRTLAWIAVIGAPVFVMLCTIVQVSGSPGAPRHRAHFRRRVDLLDLAAARARTRASGLA